MTCRVKFKDIIIYLTDKEAATTTLEEVLKERNKIKSSSKVTDFDNELVNRIAVNRAKDKLDSIPSIVIDKRLLDKWEVIFS